MDKKPEVFENVADMLKLSLTQTEKRLTDLETTVSEISEKFKDIRPDSMPELQQRIDDIEDLIMVEQAGLMELKTVMTEVDNKFGEVSTAGQSEEFQENVFQRMKVLEDRVVAASDAVEKLSGGLQGRLGRLESDVKYLSEMPKAEAGPDAGRALEEVKANLSAVKDYTEGAIENLRRDVARFSESKADFDTSVITSNIDSLKSGIDILSGKKIEMDMKIAEIDEKIEIMNNKVKEAISQKFVDEVKDNRRSITMTNARLDAVEKVIIELNGSLRDVERTAKKFEGFERLSMLNKEVEEKFGKFKLMEDEVKNLSNHIELMYQTFDNKLNKMSSAEKETERLAKDLGAVKNEIDRTRVDMMAMLKKDDVKKQFEETGRRFDEMGRQLEEALVKSKGREERLNMVEEELARIEPTFNKVAGFEKELSNLKVPSFNAGPLGDSINKLGNRLKMLEDVQVDAFNQIEALGKRAPAPAVEKPTAAPNDIRELISRIEGLSKSVSKLQGRIDSMDSRFANAAEPSAVFDAQMSDFLDKFVFLESRLAAIEAGMRKTINTQPIVLE